MNVCERCGKDFACGMKQTDKACWCTEMPKLRSIPAQYKDCLCPECLANFREDRSIATTKDVSGKILIESEDYYLERGLFVFTAKYLRERGYCCNSGCRHCPWE